MITHCGNELPLEGCGLLSGKNGVAESIWPMKNMDQSPHSYSMDMKQVGEIFDLIHSRNENLVGIYHSHPTAEAYPSLADINCNHYPEVAHIIISFARSPARPDVKVFRLKDAHVIPLPIVKINEHNL